LFKNYETTFATLSFDWVESHSRSAKMTKSEECSGIIHLDAKGVRLSDDHEVWHMEVSGPPWMYDSKHGIGDSWKCLKTEIVNLISVLENHLDVGVELGSKVRVYSTQIIGE
jgi:hypothetical protein